MTAVTRIFADIPSRIAKLPRSDKGFPIPYFAEEVDGVRDFRIVSPVKMAHAVRHDICWTCGERLGRYKAFVIGPMCGVNRTISDPPSHRECAVFSALNCPFLSRPMATRRTTGLPADAQEAAGFGLKRNPGATGVWITFNYKRFRAHAGKAGILFRLGEPEEVLWFANGRAATRAEVETSVETGLPALYELAIREGAAAVAELETMVGEFQRLLPVNEQVPA